MSNRGKIGIPTDRSETDFLQINTDGSIDVRSRLQELFGVAPVRSLVGLTAGLISASNTSRRSLDLFNNDTTIIYLGIDNTVAVINGYPLLPYSGIGWDGYLGEIWGISTVIDTDIRVMEMNEDE